MVRFIADNETEFIRRKVIQAANQRLHAGADDLLAMAVALGSLNAIGAIEVLLWLLHQLLTV